MLVYRTVSSKELLSLINDVEYTNKNTVYGQNTFKYEEDKTYIHFFKYEDHALYYMKKRYNPIIVKYDIPDDLLGNVEYGLYGNVDTYYDDSLYHYYMPLPEYVMNKDFFKKEYIVDFSYNGVWHNHEKNDDKREFFWVEKNHLFNENESQAWTIESIYYEYIKLVSKRCEHDMSKVAKYLKTIDLDDELDKMKKNIKKHKTITKRKCPRRR